MIIVDTNAARSDWESTSVVSANAIETPLFDYLRDMPANQRPAKVKSFTGFTQAEKLNEGDAHTEQRREDLNELSLEQKRRVIAWTYSLEAQKFDPYNQFDASAREAGKARKRRQERDATWMLFDFTNNIATGSPLYSNSHSIGDQTLDNLAAATALSESTLETMLTQVFDQDDAKNEPMNYMGNFKLLVGNALWLTASKIYKTTQQLGSDNNDANVAREYFKPMRCPFAPSATAYVLVPESKEDHFLWKSVKLEGMVGMDKKANGYVEIVQTDLYEVGAELPYNTVGSAGA